MFLRNALLIAVSFVFFTGCGINSVTKAEIEAIKPGDKITYRYQKTDQDNEGNRRSWFYADKVTRVDADTIYFNPSKKESTKGSDARLNEYDTTRELSIKKVDILKYETEQPPDEKKIIWIQ